MLYTAHATAEGPHCEHRGVEIHAMADTGRGWTDKGVVQRSPVMEWRQFEPEVADLQLARMGWTRNGFWTAGGGVWFATVVRRQGV